MSNSRLIALALVTLVAGLALPSTLELVRPDERERTQAELEHIRSAAQRYCADTRDLPRALLQLVRHVHGTGWRGPYLSGDVELADLCADAWGRAYQVESQAGRLRVSSAGRDGRFETSDDLEIVLEADWSRRALTRARLREIHAALVRYTARHGLEAALPGDWPSALGRLVEERLLPSREGYERDAWGSAFEEWPRGLAPVVRVRSIHLGPHSAPRG